MVVMDASFLVAMLLNEPEADHLVEVLDSANSEIFISPVSVFEAVNAVARPGSGGRRPDVRSATQSRLAIGGRDLSSPRNFCGGRRRARPVARPGQMPTGR